MWWDMNGKRILQGMVEIYENEFMCGYEGEDKEQLRLTFLELILQVTRYVNGYRYCDNPNCRCSPEFKIRAILETKNGKKILDEFLGGFALTDVPTGRIREFLFRITKVETV